jgi:hypothetical protein
MSENLTGQTAPDTDETFDAPDEQTPANPPQPQDPPTQTEGQENKPPTLPPTFTRANVKRVVPITVQHPLYPGVNFDFVFRVALSKTVQDAREEWLGTSVVERNKPERVKTQTLNEVFDLLTDDPTGFGDLPEGLMAPGDKLRAYYEGTTDPVAKGQIYDILEAANTGYWGTVLPRAFPTQV